MEPIDTAEYEARLARVRGELGKLGQAALIVEAGVDMRYLGGPQWGLSERPLLLIIPRDADAVLVGSAMSAATDGAAAVRALGGVVRRSRG